jgi:hypothetical protein
MRQVGYLQELNRDAPSTEHEIVLKKKSLPKLLRT